MFECCFATIEEVENIIEWVNRVIDDYGVTDLEWVKNTIGMSPDKDDYRRELTEKLSKENNLTVKVVNNRCVFKLTFPETKEL